MIKARPFGDEDAADMSQLRRLGMEYDVPEYVLGQSRLSYGEIHYRLTRADTDAPRPDAYAAGWLDACDKIALVDAAWDALPEDSPDEDCPKTIGDMLEYAGYRIKRHEADRYRVFLYGDVWTEAERCELAEWRGRHDCAECACRYINRVDNDIPSQDLAKILQKYSSVQEMFEHIRERQAIDAADHRLFVIGGLSHDR